MTSLNTIGMNKLKGTVSGKYNKIISGFEYYLYISYVNEKLIDQGKK